MIQKAFQAGVPVVGAAIGGIPEFIRDGGDGRLFDPRRPAELTAILHDLIDRPESLRALTASRPTVKSMEEDATDWEQRCRLLLAGRAITERAS